MLKGMLREGFFGKSKTAPRLAARHGDERCLQHYACAAALGISIKTVVA